SAPGAPSRASRRALPVPRCSTRSFARTSLVPHARESNPRLRTRRRLYSIDDSEVFAADWGEPHGGRGASGGRDLHTHALEPLHFLAVGFVDRRNRVAEPGEFVVVLVVLGKLRSDVQLVRIVVHA